MDDLDGSGPDPRRNRRRASAAALLGAGAVAGGILAGTIGASAASGGSTGTSATPSTTSTTTAPPGAPANARSATPVRSDEKQVTGALAATLKANALAAVPGGTVYRIETDAGDGVYEAHMTKADGSLVTVKFDKAGKVTKVEDGMGTGDPGGHGGPPGGAPGAGTGAGVSG
jgi:hypothetical protein